MRSQAREAVFKFLFSQLFNENDEGLFTVLCKELNAEDKQFAFDLLSAVDKEKYLADIERLAIGYNINRLYPADKCALLLGFTELNRFPETPVAVVVDQTVSLVAKYSTENSTNFVNGIMAEYIREKK